MTLPNKTVTPVQGLDLQYRSSSYQALCDTNENVSTFHADVILLLEPRSAIDFDSIIDILYYLSGSLNFVVGETKLLAFYRKYRQILSHKNYIASAHWAIVMYLLYNSITIKATV